MRSFLVDTLLIVGLTVTWLANLKFVLRWLNPTPSASQRREEIAYQFHPDCLSALKPGEEKRHILSPPQ